MNKTLAILAAGIGSRYGGIKQMEPIGPFGAFIIDYSVYDAMRAGFNRVVFIIRKEIEHAFRKTVGKRLEKHIHCVYAFQEIDDLPAPFQAPRNRSKPWGTVQALLACEALIHAPFIIINADDYYGRDAYLVLSEALDHMQPQDAVYAMAGFKLNNTLSDYGTVTRGICQADPEGILTSIVEQSGLQMEKGAVRVSDSETLYFTGEELVSMNFWGLTPTVFPQMKNLFVEFLSAHIDHPSAEFVLPTAIGSLVERGTAQVRVLPTSSPWFGITNPRDRADVEEKIRTLIKKGGYPENLWGKSV